MVPASPRQLLTRLCTQLLCMLAVHTATHFDLLYSNSMCKQSSIPTCELQSGSCDSITATSMPTHLHLDAVVDFRFTPDVLHRDIELLHDVGVQRRPRDRHPDEVSGDSQASRNARSESLVPPAHSSRLQSRSICLLVYPRPARRQGERRGEKQTEGEEREHTRR
eukprot:SAG25_NODE_6230_length_577_cov_0.958159_1_plen_164_part_01